MVGIELRSRDSPGRELGDLVSRDGAEPHETEVRRFYILTIGTCAERLRVRSRGD